MAPNTVYYLNAVTNAPQRGIPMKGMCNCLKDLLIQEEIWILYGTVQRPSWPQLPPDLSTKAVIIRRLQSARTIFEWESGVSKIKMEEPEM